MDLDEIQSVQSRERQTDSLQQLRDSFYREAGEFIAALRSQREDAAARADDPFDAPEVNRLSDDIATAEQTLEAIYERRVGKIVKMASLAAADMPTEEDGLTTEERDLFENLVGAIESNRGRVFDVLDGAMQRDEGAASATPTERDPGRDSPTDRPADTSGSKPDAASRVTDGTSATPTESGSSGSDSVPTEVAAADLMGGQEEPDRPADEASAAAGASETETDDPSGTGRGRDDGATRGDGGGPRGSTPEHESGASTSPGAAASDSQAIDSQASDGQAIDSQASDGQIGSAESTRRGGDKGDREVERTTVRVTADVGEILGVDDRAYDLAADDVVSLPAANAEPLLQRDAAEKLE